MSEVGVSDGRQTRDASPYAENGVAARLLLLEPLTCIALAGHAVAVHLVSAEGLSSPATWAAAVLAAAGVIGLLGRRVPWAAAVRAGIVLVTAYVLLALRNEGSGYFLLWFFVLVSVYPLVLPRTLSRCLVPAVPLAYLMLVPLGAADGPPPVALLRAVSLALIGLFVHLAASAYREAVADRDSALAVLDTYVDATPVGLGFWDTDLRYRRLNAALVALSGLPLADHLGRSVLDLPSVSPVLALNLRRVLHTGEPVHEVEIESAGRVWMSSCFPVRLGSRLLGVGAVAVDVTDQRLARAELSRSATHDALTGLPNRDLFTDRLTVALAQAERGGELTAVLFCDLDRFKVINDSLGHAAGDEVLRLMTARLGSVVQSGDTLARLGGDEFAILRTEVPSAAEARAFAERVRSAVREPLQLGGRTVTATVSVGLTVCGPAEQDAASLLRDADVAMYQAKDGGRDRVATIDDTLRRGASERLELHGALRRAVDNDEITVVYQPVVTLAHAGAAGLPHPVIGFEALARWRRPGHGDVPPADFIPLAEDLGLIHALGEHVLRTACTAVREWREETGLPLTVAVNLSARQLETRDCAARVAAVLDEVGLPASALVLEVTESVLMLDVQTSMRELGELRRLGVTLAIDDFGTGYSSLAYLRDLPVDVLKIDRSFTSRMPDIAALFVFMVELTHALGAVTVVEGVETAAQLEAVTHVGCDQVQGYFVSRPLHADAVSPYLRDALEGSGTRDEAADHEGSLLRHAPDRAP
ncbi:MAG TPA: EAL domain-containing protein [Actinotalea sp.]|jgi:diguanylate cyclase (GGDEF)-like protein